MELKFEYTVKAILEWSWLVMDGVQMDFGISFDAAPTIDTVMSFRGLSGGRQR